MKGSANAKVFVFYQDKAYIKILAPYSIIKNNENARRKVSQFLIVFLLWQIYLNVTKIFFKIGSLSFPMSKIFIEFTIKILRLL